MDVREQLRAPVGADEPGDPGRARAIFARGRRRRTRRLAVGVGGGVAAVLVAAVVVPNVLGGGGTVSPRIDDVAGAPELDPGPSTDDRLPVEPTPTDDAEDEPTSDDVPTSDADPDAANPPVEPSAEPPTAPAPVGDDASTEDRATEPAGPADLVLTDVRVGVHPGFDRVTLEFSGEGRPGWFTELGDEAVEHGAGREFDVEGDAVLTVFANMLAFPPELPEGTARWDGTTVAAPADAAVLTEVVDAEWFEGQRQLFLGLREPVPYRIGRLDDPGRIVIDLLHP